MNKCLELHIKHNYFVKAEKLKENQVKVRFPKHIKESLPELETTYQLLDKEFIMSYNGKLRKLKSPNYALRTLMMADILINLDVYDIATELIVLYENNEIVKPANGLMDLIKPTFDAGDEKKELGMTTILTQVVLGDFSDVKQNTEKFDIEEGVEVLFLLLQGD